MRFTILVTATSALVMAMLAGVTRMDEDSDASPASLSGSRNSTTASRNPDDSMSAGRAPTFDRKTEPASGLVARLANDPHAALEKLLQASEQGQSPSLSADPHLQSAVRAAANRLMQSAQSPSGKSDSGALENFVQLWAAADVRSACEWVHQIPAGHMRNALMVRVVYVGSRIAPAEAASLVVEELPPGALQEEAAMMVLHQWALQDPASAAAWVALFPDDYFRDRALRELQGIADYQQANLAAP